MRRLQKRCNNFKTNSPPVKAKKHETPAKREARLLRTENEDIEKLRASIEEAKLDTEKQKASLGDHTLALSKPDTEYKSSLQRKSIR
ncbi:hypothetical protein N0V91_010737 [Didymella pomorum]|uniref:Uncharacterized protein n=1 Tax=Didymella pomorum TaxID=749634 RepID=A0A9W8YYQ0_9PLEO|nr:hypothetical protein N0V91_010737 [Didymella pomorum]